MASIYKDSKTQNRFGNFPSVLKKLASIVITGGITGSATAKGLMPFAIRKDTAVALGADGKLVPLIVDKYGKLWVTSNGSAGGSDGDTTWTLDATNSSGEGKVTTGGTGTDTITVSAFYTTMVAERIIEIKEFDSTGALVDTHTHNNALITVSGTTIKVDGESWGASSTFVVKYDGVAKTIDLGSNSQNNTQLNTDPFFNTPEHIVDEADIAIAKYFKAIYMDNYNTLDIAILAADDDLSTFSFKLYRTLDRDATVPATGGTPGDSWHEITTDIFGGAVSGAAIDENEANIKGSPYAYLLEYEVLDQKADSYDIWYRKYFV